MGWRGARGAVRVAQAVQKSRAGGGGAALVNPPASRAQAQRLPVGPGVSKETQEASSRQHAPPRYLLRGKRGDAQKENPGLRVAPASAPCAVVAALKLPPERARGSVVARRSRSPPPRPSMSPASVWRERARLGVARPPPSAAAAASVPVPRKTAAEEARRRCCGCASGCSCLRGGREPSSAARCAAARRAGTSGPPSSCGSSRATAMMPPVSTCTRPA